MSPCWLPASDFARLAGISDRKARHALSLAYKKSQTWRGQAILARQVRGRGGRSGLHYEVLVSSLPLGLQETLKDHFTADEAPGARRRNDGLPEREWWSLILSPAAAHPPKSRERCRAIDALMSRQLTDRNGAQIIPSRRTIERKLALIDAGDMATLGGRTRRDKGTVRTVISARWQSAMPTSFYEIERARLAQSLQGYIRGHYTKGASYRIISTLAAHRLMELTRAAGVDVSAMPPETFDVPRRFIAAERTFQNVAIFNKDRKAYEDARPRIMRTREGLTPTQIVVGDVHHLDIVMRRPDGTEAWPKAIGWLDLATNRVWLDLVLLAKGEGIRNADVIASFIRMVTAWGVPGTLYLDNGSEYRWPEFVDDALKLVARVHHAPDDRDSRVVRAQPYNASAKAIEGIFRVLEQSYFRTLPGWAGGDRTNKKTQQVGRPTEPFPGTLDDLRTYIGHTLALYEISRQSGALNNRSPREAYEAAITAGWQPIAIDARELHTVFAADELRTPRQGYVRVGGDSWTCPELQAYLGERIIVRVPKFEAPAMLPLLDPATRAVVGYAVPATRYGILDQEGARASSAMARIRRNAIRDLERAAPDVDTNAEIARVATMLPPVNVVPFAGTVSLSNEASDIARGLSEPPLVRGDRRQQTIRKQRLARLAAYDRLDPRGTE